MLPPHLSLVFLLLAPAVAHRPSLCRIPLLHQYTLSAPLSGSKVCTVSPGLSKKCVNSLEVRQNNGLSGLEFKTFAHRAYTFATLEGRTREGQLPPYGVLHVCNSDQKLIISHREY